DRPAQRHAGGHDRAEHLDRLARAAEDLAERRRPQRHATRRLPDQRARARDPVPGRRARGLHPRPAPAVEPGLEREDQWPGAAPGLAVLIVASRRELRLGGLLAWALGCAFLAAYLAPNGHTKIYAGAAVVGALGAVVIAAVFRRWPWLIGVSALACAPARIPV